MVKPTVPLTIKADRKAGIGLSFIRFLLRGLYSRQCPDFFHALLQVVCLLFHLLELKRNVTANDWIIFNQVVSPSTLQAMVSILTDISPWTSLLLQSFGLCLGKWYVELKCLKFPIGAELVGKAWVLATCTEIDSQYNLSALLRTGPQQWHTNQMEGFTNVE